MPAKIGSVTERLLLKDLALADGISPQLRLGVAVLVEDGHIAWLGSTEEADVPGAEVLDGGGATLIPAMVDGHSHLTGQGGSHWIERFSDPPERLLAVARENAERLVQAGILWARDVGAPSDNGRPLNITIREELRDRPGQPYIRAAGTWVAKTGYLEPLTISAADGAALRELALAQLDLGADFVKIMLDPPAGTGDSAPFSVDEVRGVCEAVHARGRRITAHASIADAARVGALAGVDSIEHGFAIDADVARTMAANNVALVSTLSVLASWQTFARTTRIERFASEDNQRRVLERREQAFASVGMARKAGVRIAAGSDFGGGSVRAGHLAWEVELLIEAGLEPHEALGAATWRGGEVLGEEFAGRVVQGAPADFVLVHGDPLSDPAALWRVWAVYQHGRRVA
jgi:imidazolonepropionase-like amidohydrolase